MLSHTIRRSCLRQLSPHLPTAHQQLRHESTTSPTPSFTHLISSLKARPKRIIRDWISLHNTQSLDLSLSDFIPQAWNSSLAATAPRSPSVPPFPLPPAHHLLYFNHILPDSQLLADGTDPLQSPGEPFTRRMWAGGYVQFEEKGGRSEPLMVNTGEDYVCLEGIREVLIKGRPGEEKVIVGIERRFAGLKNGGGAAADVGELEARLWREDEDDFGERGLVRLIERRNVIFMRERPAREIQRVREEGAAPPIEKMIKAQHKPTFSHTLTPTATLLFRYSALTFNAHAIHLDKGFCTNTEGHRNLLFHGPLSFTLITTLLNHRLKVLNEGKSEMVLERIEYRNIAPLYAEEELTLCGRETGEGKFELWIENAKGGVAVTARAWTKRRE